MAVTTAVRRPQRAPRGVLALMVFLELHAGRVADPEELTARVRVPVVGIVPPLPTAQTCVWMRSRTAPAVLSSEDSCCWGASCSYRYLLLPKMALPLPGRKISRA